MVVMEASHLTGYQLVDLDDVKRQGGSGLKRLDDDDDKTVIYFDEVCLTCLLPLTRFVLPVCYL